MAPRKQYVYAVVRRDYEDEKDKKGVFSLVDVHATMDSANKAAEVAAGDDQDEISHTEIKEGCRTYKNKTEHTMVQVKKMELKGSAEADGNDAASAVSSVAKTTKTTAAATKKASSAASAKTKASESKGKEGALSGMKLIFTGTLEMDRKTCEAKAREHGAKILGPTKLEETDLIVLGTKPGPKKVQEIEEKGLKTCTEAEFVQMLGEEASDEDEPQTKKRKT